MLLSRCVSVGIRGADLDGEGCNFLTVRVAGYAKMFYILIASIEGQALDALRVALERPSADE